MPTETIGLTDGTQRFVPVGRENMPGVDAGVTDRLWSLEDIIARIDADAPAPKARGPYKKRGD
jgi:hypothetical protein